MPDTGIFEASEPPREEEEEEEVNDWEVTKGLRHLDKGYGF